MDIFQHLVGMLKPARYDTEAINLLSNKRILAKLLKEVVPEVQKYSLKEIESFISDEKIQKVGVHPGTKLLDKVKALATESKIVGEGVVRFDLVLNLNIPNNANGLRIIINVEAQGKDNPGYDLITRVIYYCCRLISEQHETEFSDSNYDDIKKVYSIWICMPRKKSESSIESYSIHRKQDFGKSKQNVRFDLFKGVVIRLGKNFSKEKTFLDELSVLFSDTISVEEKMQYLSSDTELIGDATKFQEGLERMRNLEESIKEESYKKGEKDKALEIAKNMLTDNMSKEQIIALTGLSAEEFDKLLVEEKEN